MFASSYVKSDARERAKLEPAEAEVVTVPNRALRWKGIRQFLAILRKGRLFLLILPPTSAAAQTVVGDAPLLKQPLIQKTRDLLLYELVPLRDRNYKGAPFHTNRWGMRDKDYSLKPSPRTYRIALLGSSYSMGAGVPVEQTHEWLLEERLNREGPGAPRRHYEILNFSVGGYGIMQYVALTDGKIFPFAPNGVVILIHSNEEKRLIAHVIALIQANVPVPYSYIQQKLKGAGVKPGMEQPELTRRIGPLAPDLIRWAYRHIADVCRERRVPLVAILFPEPREGREERFSKLSAWASEAGIPVLSLVGAFGGHASDSVRLPGDLHLNALGHRLVADRLYEALRTNDARGLKLGFGQTK